MRERTRYVCHLALAAACGIAALATLGACAAVGMGRLEVTGAGMLGLVVLSGLFVLGMLLQVIAALAVKYPPHASAYDPLEPITLTPSVAVPPEVRRRAQLRRVR